jgi:hypothetical protein
MTIGCVRMTSMMKRPLYLVRSYVQMTGSF